MIAVVVGSILIAQVAARIMIKNGIQWGFADVPNERSAHNSVVPKGGGIGIPIAVMITAAFFAPSLIYIVSISLLVATMAFINDRNEFSVVIRIIIEAAGASIIIFLSLLKVWAESSPIITAALVLFAILYIVGQANFFNFMDGINGIAAVEAIISFVLLGIFALLKGKPDVYMVCFAVAAATAGFLPANFPRARVFMGDSGSVFLGFLFAVFALTLATSPTEFFLLAMFQGIFSIDCSMTIVRRIIRGENLFFAHKEHLYQKMVHKKGWTHTRTTLIYGGVQILFGTGALLLYQRSAGVIILLWLALISLYIVTSSALGLLGPREIFG